MTFAILAAAIALLTSYATTAAGPYLILMILAVTLLNQIVHNYCDAALMLQVSQAKDTGSIPPLGETSKGVNGTYVKTMCAGETCSQTE